MQSVSTFILALFSVALSLGLSACQSTAAPTIIKPSTESSTPSSTKSSAVLVMAANPSNDAPRAPWTNAPINSSATDAVYRQEWLKAESQSLCPMLALPKHSSAHLSSASVRRANFAGGWGVAYDLSNLRSAYGVANASTVNPQDLSHNWPYNVTYQDGSTLSYGHEGGNPTAPWLAYIVLPKNNCFYNVWSAQGKEHLEQIIADLRLVNP